MGREVKPRKKPEPVDKFKQGDRVKEINKNTDYFVSRLASDEYKKKVQDIRANIRVGTVTKTYVVKNKAGARRMYADVIWDGYAQPTAHEQTRLTLLDAEGVTA